jgi:hypothetical protein
MTDFSRNTKEHVLNWKRFYLSVNTSIFSVKNYYRINPNVLPLCRDFKNRRRSLWFIWSLRDGVKIYRFEFYCVQRTWYFIAPLYITFGFFQKLFLTPSATTLQLTIPKVICLWQVFQFLTNWRKQTWDWTILRWVMAIWVILLSYFLTFLRIMFAA